jgi:hypothetical protein
MCGAAVVNSRRNSLGLYQINGYCGAEKCRFSSSTTSSQPRTDRSITRPVPCGLIEPSSTLHPLWPYRSSNCADQPVAQRRCVLGSSAGHPQSGTHWTWPVDDFRRIAQGHHRDASCLAFANCAQSSAITRRAKRTTIPLRRLHCASATNNPKHCKSSLQKVKIFKSLSPPGDPPAIRLPRTRL